MKKTTVMIDEQLLKEAMLAIDARSKKEAITVGLQTIVKQQNRERLRKELGTFEIDLKLDELLRLRSSG